MKTRLTLQQLKERERDLWKALEWIEEEIDFADNPFHRDQLEIERQRAGEKWGKAKEDLDQALKRS